MKQLKRYHITKNGMLEGKEGHWIKYEDYKAVIASITITERNKVIEAIKADLEKTFNKIGK